MKNIKDESIDLILTDLPYIISKKSNFDVGGAWNDSEDIRKRKTPPKTDFGEWDKIPLDLETIISEFYRVIKKGGTLISFYDIWKMQEFKDIAEQNKFKQARLLRWDKSNPMPTNSKINYLSTVSEYFTSFTKVSKPTFNSEYDKGIYVFPICSGNERTEHPTQKPLKLMEELILKHSNTNDIILDPFMGSGSTGVACVNTNRRFIGIELDKDYYNIAKERMNII